ncbi:MAG: UbiX family flavin prenyltransferase [Leptospiraceae bacterium]|nr:UbiX family flavin prenyltransferase [Leptospiraceae bacterium]MDW8307500.1 UbiX family flavin prenyltransferase [Leptospiraceae bacterium]
MDKKRFVIALTGASGAAYGLRLLYQLSKLPVEAHLIFSPVFWRIAKDELNFSKNEPQFDQVLTEFFNGEESEVCWKYEILPHGDVGLRPASGSFAHDGMVVIPCSMKTLAAIAHGYTSNLIERAADVSLKEKRKLILVIRETPLSLIHIENMRQLSLAGAVIMPAAPGFYHKPHSLTELYDFICDRIFLHLGLNKRLVTPWQG